MRVCVRGKVETKAKANAVRMAKLTVFWSSVMTCSFSSSWRTVVLVQLTAYIAFDYLHVHLSLHYDFRVQVDSNLYRQSVDVCSKS